MKANYIAKAGLVVFLLSPLAFSSSFAQPADPGGHTNRGVEYARAKQYDKAIEEFSKAIEAQPKDPKNYVNRAQVYQAPAKQRKPSLITPR
jgi:Tfp pilus assembly protein PilF